MQGPSPTAAGGRDPSAKPAARVTPLESALWSRLTEASSQTELAEAWLELLAERIGGAARGVVVIGAAEKGPFKPIAHWPLGDVGGPLLSSAAELAIKERRGVVRGERANEAGSEAQTAIAQPLLIDGELFGVAAFEIGGRPTAQLRDAMRELQWGLGWLEALVRRGGFAGRERAASLLELVAIALEHPRFQAAATATATELATRFSCDRVSIGTRKGEHNQVVALSHSAGFVRGSNLIRAIGAAMDEASDQQATLVHPAEPESTPRVVVAHESLARHHASAAICSVPLADGGEWIGGLTLERTDAIPFEPAEVALIEHCAALLGPLLEVKRRDDRMVIGKLYEALREQVVKLTGPRHAGLKLALPLSLLVLLFLAFASGTYRVTAEATLEGQIQRSIAAPIDGYIAEQHARAGDVVEAGDLLAALDDRDLEVEKLRWESQHNRRLREYTKALADGDRAQVRILSAQLEQAKAQIQLIEEQLIRTRVLAPIQGLVVKGDLSQHLNAPVSRGDVLFEIAPLHEYRVVLQVDERDVGSVEVGQQGHLALAGLTGETLPMTVQKITPTASAEEGLNFFRVEARLDGGTERVRPGMEGVGKIAIGPRRLLWIYTHKLVRWWKLWSWSWLP